ncbi:hypothetical protein FOC35_22655 [Cedecea sp. FDAARGOS_727]|nr:hypothetical protein [Cedecea sp. FDAARGOS_727]QIX98309.1 hypothetical protein FOC35_22655 [Cedecea sp. FDAARGOS_727]
MEQARAGRDEAFDLLVYADALVILHGYEKIKWPDAPEWAQRNTWIESLPGEMLLRRSRQRSLSQPVKRTAQARQN